jgi:hypothetical protein
VLNAFAYVRTPSAKVLPEGLLYLGTLYLGTLSLISFFGLDASVPRPLNRGTSNTPVDTSAPVLPLTGAVLFTAGSPTSVLRKSDAQKLGIGHRAQVETLPVVRLLLNNDI